MAPGVAPAVAAEVDALGACEAADNHVASLPEMTAGAVYFESWQQHGCSCFHVCMRERQQCNAAMHE